MFPEGALPFLANICGWAADQGFYIIIDLHGAPFAQVSGNADSGQLASTISDSSPAFYQRSQYDRAYQFLTEMTNYIHNNGGATGSMRNVGMLEILNEPQTSISPDLLVSMNQVYYPGAINVSLFPIHITNRTCQI